MKTLISLVTIMATLTACQDHRHPESHENLAHAKTQLNVSYGNDSLQVMDIYLPPNRSPVHTKAMVLIHGGGWNGGSKAEFGPYIDSLKKRLPGYAIFNLNYRLVNSGNVFPAQEQDINTAISFITNHAPVFGINSEQMALLGFSAGAHLALLQAYKYHQPAVKAVIDFFGPADLISMYRKPWHPLVRYALQMVTGTDPDVDPDLFHQSSPVNFIGPDTPPTLILHGRQDNVVDIAQSENLKSRLDAAGVANELIVYLGERHGWYGKTLSNSFDRIEQFLKTWMK